MKNIFKIALVMVAGLAVLAGVGAKAQPYYTNSTTVPGPYQYNTSYVPPYNASTVLSNQVASGISQGTILPGGGGLLNSAILVSNSFSGIYYSAAPTVVASSSLPGTNGVVSVQAVTSKYFVLNVSTTNANTIYWYSVGH